MIQSLFGQSIDCDKVRIYARPYLRFGLQDKNTAMAPNGHVYFGRHHFREDFSRASPADRHWFMHELSHVWQYQRGYALRLNGIRLHWLRRTDPYSYVLTQTSRLQDFNMEQQACILADYFSIIHQLGVFSASGRQVRDIRLFKKTLRGFFDNPRSPALLPESRRFASSKNKWPE